MSEEAWPYSWRRIPQENTGWHDNVTITVRQHTFKMTDDEFQDMLHQGDVDKYTREKQVVTMHNAIYNVALNMMRDVLRGTVLDGKIKYLAWGSSAAPIAVTDGNLVAEYGRKVITQQSVSTTGRVLTTTYVAPNDAAGTTIRELGWFAGAAATMTANTGILVAKILYTKIKTNLESIQVDRTDIFTAP